MHAPAPKHIAVILAGIDEEYQQSVLKGIIACAREQQANIACFTAFGGVLGSGLYDIGEYNIYNLIRFDRFDGAILMTNTVGNSAEREKVLSRVRASGIPAAILDGSDAEEFCNIRINNAKAMRRIVEHIIEEHGAKRLCFIAGTPGNPEADLRMQSFLDVMAEHGLPVSEEDLFPGEFRPADGARAAEALLSSGKPLPDAIISANDAMALEAMRTLERSGVRIPEDILVTGFDNTFYAQYHCPALTTVSRPLFDAGYQACSTVLRVIGGEPGGQTVSMEAFPVFRESCGCTDSEETDIRRYKKKTYELLNSSRTGVSLLNRMTSALAEAETEEALLQSIGSFMHELQCEKCCICLCDDWQQAFHEKGAEEEQPYCVSGYTETMSAPLIWERGTVSSISAFRSGEMYPVQPESGGNVSYFLPLHFRERCLGYYIITNSDFPLKSSHCHSLMMNISHSMENVRKLLHLNNAVRELDRLYVIDPLCGIYNRNGFIRLADRMFRQCMESGDSIMIAFIDMDGLKYVNDNYGHDEGDFALQRLASVIRDICTGNAVCARFGGDEFIAVASGVAEDAGTKMEADFKQHLAEVNGIIGKPYPLAASIGSFVTNVTPEMKLFSLIAQADQIMYEQKKRKKTSRYLRKD
ncbi:MAG: GGDEF domain-containing protein [Oscillospiraceae bacterium]|nr:GGDEF domain-containing protein [Oscillospiraceae bacterium]